MSKEEELSSNFEDEPEYDFKFDWSTGKTYEHWIDVVGGKVRIRTEIEYFRLPEEAESKPNEIGDNNE